MFLGTQIDNNHDMAAKGRAPVGEKHGNARLTRAQIELIRSAVGSERELGEQFGVHRTHIGKIKRNKRWRQLTKHL